MSKLLWTAVAVVLVSSTIAQAETVEEARARINKNVVGILGGTPGSTEGELISDLNLAFSNDNPDLRILPIVGEGSNKNVEELLFLRGIDMAVVQQDIVDYMVSQNVYSNLRDAVRLVAPLSIDQLHVLGRRDIPTLYDLAGQKVNFGPADTGTFLTSTVVFDALDIDVEVTTYPHQLAVEKVRTGEIAAMLRASGKPASHVEGITVEEGLQLMSVPIEPLANIYAPTTLTAQDYPALIDPSTPVTTIAIPNSLITYNWPRDHPRGKAVEEFIETFFSNFDELRGGGYSEKWQQIDIALPVPGLKRFWAAEEALSRMQTQ